jgi:hypothetical protein
MWRPAIQREQASRAEIECSPCRAHPDVADEDMDRDSSGRFVFGNPDMSLDGRQHDTEVIVLHERPGVLTGVPRRLSMKAIDFRRDIEFEERTRH